MVILALNNWEELNKKHNITNISFNKICTILRKLYNAKQIFLCLNLAH